MIEKIANVLRIKPYYFFIDRTEQNTENTYPKLPKSMQNEIRSELNLTMNDLIKEILNRYWNKSKKYPNTAEIEQKDNQIKTRKSIFKFYSHEPTRDMISRQKLVMFVWFAANIHLRFPPLDTPPALRYKKEKPWSRRLKVSLRKTSDTDSDPYGSKTYASKNTAGFPETVRR